MGGKNERGSRNPNQPLSRREREAQQKAATEKFKKRRLLIRAGFGGLATLAVAGGAGAVVYIHEQSSVNELDNTQRQQYPESGISPKERGEIAIDERKLDYFNYTDYQLEEPTLIQSAKFINDYAKRGYHGTYDNGSGGVNQLAIAPTVSDGVNKSLFFILPRSIPVPSWASQAVTGYNFEGFTDAVSDKPGLWRNVVLEPTSNTITNKAMPNLDTPELYFSQLMLTTLINNFQDAFSDTPTNTSIAQVIWPLSFSAALMYHSINTKYKDYVNMINTYVLQGKIARPLIQLKQNDYDNFPTFSPILRSKQP